ncbi:MAG: DNA-3-methyladenine glycosylase [Candidatus Dormibacteraeota bacterium]|nr:DNA-3-methyladenine glycosylase [Candidatus Dormibacteraeota bacterium]
MPLERAWFARPTIAVARDLVGCTLVVDAATDAEVRAVLVEVEAYLGTADPASHAYRGPTPRAAIMFGPAGHLYVYLSYGVHYCANVVTEADGTGGAVLLRAASVVEGEPLVRQRRGRAGAIGPAAALLRGPGNLCQGLGIALADNGTDVTSATARVELMAAVRRPPLSRGTRVGISVAADERLRFAWRGHPAVSRPLPWAKEKGPNKRALDVLPSKRQPGGNSRA